LKPLSSLAHLIVITLKTKVLGCNGEFSSQKSKVLSIYELFHGLGANEVNMLEVNYQYNIPGIKG
jgi:hypothetical protein